MQYLVHLVHQFWIISGINVSVVKEKKQTGKTCNLFKKYINIENVEVVLKYLTAI